MVGKAVHAGTYQPYGMCWGINGFLPPRVLFGIGAVQHKLVRHASAHKAQRRLVIFLPSHWRNGVCGLVSLQCENM